MVVIGKRKASSTARLRGFNRYGRDRSGNVSLMFALLLIPICGVLALAVEVGNASMQQRTQQHAADAAALAAATGNDITQHGTGVYGWYREAMSVAKSYPIGSSATVTPSNPDCPGSAAGSKDCYEVVISRPFTFYLARMLNRNSMTATATAYARISSQKDLCLISLGSGGITTDGKSTGFGTCYAESLGTGQVKCTSVAFAGLFSPTTPQACNNSTYTPISSSSQNPITSVASSIPTSGVTCSSDINSLTWTTIGTTSYAKVCSGGNLQLSADLNVAASGTLNKAIILDGQTIDTNGKNINLTGIANGVGVTVISMNSSCASNCNLSNWFVNNSSGKSKQDSTVTIQAPSNNGGGAFDNFAIYDDDSSKVTSATAFNAPNSPAVNIDITGMIYAPKRDLTFNGSIDTSIGTGSNAVANCISVLANSITSNGGKLANNPNSGCAADGYSLPTQSVSNVALVQ